MWVIIIMCAIAAIITVISWILEYVDYNHGYCPNCNEKRMLTSIDEHGGRGYCCPNNDDDGCWVSWNWVDRDRRKKYKNK